MLSDQLTTAGAAQPDRRYLRIAQELLEEINRGDYRVGTRLPSDREIALSTGVSRATVREALLVLQLIGVVEASIGAGVYVASSTPRLDRDDSILAAPADLIETRICIEPAVAALCADRMGQAEIDELSDLVKHAERAAESSQPFPRFSDLSLEFHAALANHCGNQILGSVAQQLVQVNEHPLWVLLNQSVLRSEADRKSQVAHHRAIVNAIAKRDREAASSAMAGHLGELTSLVLSRKNEADLVALANVSRE